MNKDEILEKSRLEDRDEREEQIRDKAIKWTFLMMVLTSAIFAVIRGLKGESVLDLPVIVCSSITVFQLYKYFRLKKKEFLTFGIITLSAAAICLIGFCMGR
jgi:hypothetical protein